MTSYTRIDHLLLREAPPGRARRLYIARLGFSLIPRQYSDSFNKEVRICIFLGR